MTSWSTTRVVWPLRSQRSCTPEACHDEPVLIRPVDLARIRDGEIDLAFRRWERPRLLVGTRMRTSVGLVEVTSVDEVEDVSDDDAVRAGAPREQLLKLMAPK